MAQFLRNKETGREFEVVGFNKGAGVVTLRGPNSTFDEPYDKERFKANGYELVTRVIETATTEDSDADDHDD